MRARSFSAQCTVSLAAVINGGSAHLGAAGIGIVFDLRQLGFGLRKRDLQRLGSSLNNKSPFFTNWFCPTATSMTRPATCEEIITRSAFT